MTLRKQDQRRARRILVNIPTVIEKLPARELALHPLLAAVYERVAPDASDIGLQFPATIQDLSVNGCFVAGPALPLLSKIAASFVLPELGQIEALGWVLWRRREDVHIPGDNGDGSKVLIKAGFGVLFEAISLEARLAIARMVAEHAG